MKKTDKFLMSPKVDFCFKELMSDAQVRKGFLAALLGIAPEEISDTVLLPTNLKKMHENDKLGILDVRILLNERAQLDVEIQILSFKLWPERSLFYLCKMYADQIEAGNGYEVLEKCIHVGILDFSLYPDYSNYYSVFHLWEDETKRLYSDKLEIHILELPKLARHQYPETELLKWAKFINTTRKEELEQMAKENEYIGKAYETLVNISADKQKRLEYEAREKALRDYNYLMHSNLEEGYKAGEAAGQKAGLEAGMEAGMQAGMQAGREEGRAAGIATGIEQGEDRLCQLNLNLLADKRYADLERISSDKEYRYLLFEEYEL